MVKKILIGVAAVIILIQFFGPEKTNPPVKADLIAEMNVKSILKNSCYDCHSNETKYPWYSSIVPVSYFLMGHINEAREHLNFSDWENFDTSRKEKKLKEILEEVEENHMPLSSYLRLHPEAELDSTQKDILMNWAKTMLSSSGEK